MHILLTNFTTGNCFFLTESREDWRNWWTKQQEQPVSVKSYWQNKITCSCCLEDRVDWSDTDVGENSIDAGSSFIARQRRQRAVAAVSQSWKETEKQNLNFATHFEKSLFKQLYLIQDRTNTHHKRIPCECQQILEMPTNRKKYLPQIISSHMSNIFIPRRKIKQNSLAGKQDSNALVSPAFKAAILFLQYKIK